LTRLLSALAAFAAVLAFAAAPASALTPAQKIAKLQKQVTQLQKDVKFLKTEVAANYDGDACLASVTADTFQQSWLFVGGFPAASTTPAVTTKDFGCPNIRVQRQVPTPGRAPTVAIYQAILTWIG
jgi:hypothetical protein